MAAPSASTIASLPPYGYGPIAPARTRKRFYGPLGGQQQHSAVRFAPYCPPNQHLSNMMPDPGSKIHQPGWTHQMFWPQADGSRRFTPDQSLFAPPSVFDCNCPGCNFQADVSAKRFLNFSPHPPPGARTPDYTTQGLFTAQSFSHHRPIQIPDVIACHHPQPVSQYQHQFLQYRLDGSVASATSSSSSSPSLVDPAEVFRSSPVPTLSNCSTRSNSSEFPPRSAHGMLDSHIIFHENPHYDSMTMQHGAFSVHAGPDQSLQASRIREVSEDTTLSAVLNPFRSVSADVGTGENNQETTITLQSSLPSSTASPSRSPTPEPSPSASPSIASPSPAPSSSRCFTCSPSPPPSPASNNRRAHAKAYRRKAKLVARAQESRSKDELLVLWKEQGLSYREIKNRGGFSEAESTLRGRYRSLTKEKEARVRRPRWLRGDIILLRHAVNTLSTPLAAPTRRSAPSTRRHGRRHRKVTIPLKTPWKKVAEYIAEHGGSYHFGNATCRKKWDEVGECEEEDGDETEMEE